MSEYVDFHYMPLEGKITGKQVLKQTEDAINDLGQHVYEIDIDNELIQQAIDTSNQAIDTAEAALSAVTTNRAMWFNTVAEMKATDIALGITAATRGKIVFNDGDGAFYAVREIKGGDVDSDDTVFLDNGNVAERIKQFNLIAKGNNIVYVANVADLRASDAVAGLVYGTTGYYAPNDGGAGLYSIRTATPSDTDDGDSIIILDNGNVAERIKQFNLIAKGNIVYVSNVADLRTANASIGEVYATKGYSSPNDGGNGFYCIRAKVPITEQTDDTVAYSKTVPASMERATLKKIGGKTIVWNQLVNPANIGASKEQNGITFTNNGDGSVTVSGTATGNASIVIIPSKTWNAHKYYIQGCPSGGASTGYSLILYGQGASIYEVGDGSIWNAQSNRYKNLSINVYNGTVISTPITFKPTFIDLTLAFGSGNEPTLDQCKEMFPADYYSYNAGSLLSAGVTSVVAKDSNGVSLESYPIPSSIQALTGYGWSCPSAYNYIDFATKKFIQNVASRTYEAGDESDSTVITDNTNTYYELTTAIETDISSYLQGDSIRVVENGFLTFENTNGNDYRIPVPNEEVFFYGDIDDGGSVIFLNNGNVAELIIPKRLLTKNTVTTLRSNQFISNLIVRNAIVPNVTSGGYEGYDIQNIYLKNANLGVDVSKGSYGNIENVRFIGCKKAIAGTAGYWIGAISIDKCRFFSISDIAIDINSPSMTAFWVSHSVFERFRRAIKCTDELTVEDCYFGDTTLESDENNHQTIIDAQHNAKIKLYNCKLGMSCKPYTNNDATFSVELNGTDDKPCSVEIRDSTFTIDNQWIASLSYDRWGAIFVSSSANNRIFIDNCNFREKTYHDGNTAPFYLQPYACLRSHNPFYNYVIGGDLCDTKQIDLWNPTQLAYDSTNVNPFGGKIMEYGAGGLYVTYKVPPNLVGKTMWLHIYVVDLTKNGVTASAPKIAYSNSDCSETGTSGNFRKGNPLAPYRNVIQFTPSKEVGVICLNHGVEHLGDNPVVTVAGIFLVEDDNKWKLCRYRNYCNDHYSKSIPTVAGTFGDVVYSSDPVGTNCRGWEYTTQWDAF